MIGVVGCSARIEGSRLVERGWFVSEVVRRVATRRDDVLNLTIVIYT